MSAHEVRALSTSWVFVNSVALSDIMNAAYWSQASTFTKFYLRNMSTVSDDLHSLGPLSVAQQVIP